ncbi:SET domain-containing 5 protein [Rutstroemia sp. NJR-2017a BVV2]|nr:SET domain-containing 5 protein [Rutstroemia sp. NJR-2017a BVV2]
MAPSKDSPAPATANGDTSEDTPLWTIKPIPGKGLGVVAARAIAPGTLLFHESPLLTTETLKNPATTERDLAQLIRALPKESQRAYLSLHNNYPGQPSPLSNIIRSNAYPLGPSSSVGGVFKDISRINHSCLPTSQHSWNESRKEFVVYAVRELSPGDEITTSYHVGGPSNERKKELKEWFKFDCTCDLCSLPGPELAKSDERLVRAAKLDQVIGDAKRVMKHPEKALKDCRDLEIIYRQEGIQDQRVGRVYWDAFQICNRHGDLARASEFARKYRERKILGEGEDSKGAIEALVFMKDPKKHESCGGSQKWKSKVSDIPKGKNEDEFEKWLWRED